MSTIHFGAEELANVVLVLTDGQPECDALLSLQRTMSAILGLFSETNTLAYRARYTFAAGAIPVSAGEILERVLRSDRAKLDRDGARLFLSRLAIYNCDGLESPALRHALAALKSGF